MSILIASSYTWATWQNSSAQILHPKKISWTPFLVCLCVFGYVFFSHKKKRLAPFKGVAVGITISSPHNFRRKLRAPGVLLWTWMAITTQVKTSRKPKTRWAFRNDRGNDGNQKSQGLLHRKCMYKPCKSWDNPHKKLVRISSNPLSTVLRPYLRDNGV